MKLASIVIGLLLLAKSASTQQRFDAALIFGVNASQIDGDQNAGYHKFGFNAGVKAYARLGSYLSLSPELLVSQKGSRGSLVGKPVSNPPFVTVSPNPFTLQLTYAEIPILLHYHDRDRAIFGAGLSYSALVGYKRTEAGINTTDADTPLATRDINIIGDMALKVLKVFGLNLRIAYSLLSIADWQMSHIVNKQGEHLVYNNVVSLRLMWFPKLGE
jgi:hypothetical protein